MALRNRELHARNGDDECCVVFSSSKFCRRGHSSSICGNGYKFHGLMAVVGTVLWNGGPVWAPGTVG